jgi:hypothetical protein
MLLALAARKDIELHQIDIVGAYLQGDLNEEYANGFKYIEGIGAVLYATQISPNIQHAVGVLAQFGACPGKPHL